MKNWVLPVMRVDGAKTEGALEVRFRPRTEPVQHVDGIVDRVVVESEVFGVDAIIDTGPGRS